MNDAWWVTPAQLDDHQEAIISLPLSGSYLITGPPGSGKTNLLLLRANYLTLANRSNIALVVFNRALRDFIRAGCERYSFAFSPEKVHTSQSLFQSLLWQFGKVRVARMAEFREQREALAEAMQALVEENRLARVYDVILLDEAQDYTESELRLFKDLASNIFVTADSRQKIYNTPDGLGYLRSAVQKHFDLLHHYRNGLSICRFADSIAKHTADYVDMVDACNYDERAQPSSVEYFQCAGINDETDRITNKLQIQLRAYPGELIGIICPRHKELDELWRALRDNSMPGIVHLHDSDSAFPFRDANVCVCTAHSAKGLEFRALHVAGSDHFAKFPHQRNIVYTAVTRAKTSLSLYASGPLPGFLEQAVGALTTKPVLPDLASVFGGGAKDVGS